VIRPPQADRRKEIGISLRTPVPARTLVSSVHGTQGIYPGVGMEFNLMTLGNVALTARRTSDTGTTDEVVEFWATGGHLVAAVGLADLDRWGRFHDLVPDDPHYALGPIDIARVKALAQGNFAILAPAS
jgi:hypothetical protein